MADSQETVAPMTTQEKFEIVIKDFSALMETTKSLSARMKVLQKEVNKGKRGRKPPAEVDPDAPPKTSALHKPVAISNELCKFLGFEPDTEHSRRDVTQGINDYIRKHELQDPANRRFMLLTEKPEGLALKALLRDPDQPVTFFNIQRYLKPHYPMSEKDKKALEKATEDAPVPVTDTKPKSARKKLPPPVDVVPDADVVTDDPKEDVPKAPPKKRVVRNPKSA
jgi:chromatin remodeling complex protein RSC6